MRNNILLHAAIFSSLVFATGSCKKNDSTSDPATVLRSATTKWYEQFSKTASENNKDAAVKIISQLNYTDGAVVELPGDQQIFLIRAASAGQTRYLALNQTPQNLIAMGVYDAKDLKQICQFLETRKLPAGEKLTINSFDNTPLTQWETTLDGREHLRMIQDKTSAIRAAGANHISTQGVRINNAPTEGKCIDYYWVDYNIVTGEIYSAEYAYTSCITNSTGGGRGSEDNSCRASAQSDISNSYSTSELLYVTDDEHTAITRTRSYHWKIYSGVTWSINSHEIGVHRYSRSDGKWQWVSLTHNNVSVNGFLFGGSVTCTVNTAVPNIYPEYAGLELNYTVKSEFICKGSPVTNSFDNNSSTIIHVNQTS